MKRLFIIAIALIVGLSVGLSIGTPAKADFVVGMMAYTDVGVYWRDTERMKKINPTVDSGVYDVFVSMPHHSRLYSKCTTEVCGGYFELGVGSDVETSSVGFANTNFRKLYGWYDFGPFRIEAGHTEPIGACRFNPTQLFGLGRALHIILAGWGNIYERMAQVNLIYQGGPLYAAVGVGTNTPFGIFQTGEEYNTVPVIFVTAGISTATFSILPNLTFQQAEAKDTTQKDSAVQAWVVEIPVVIKAGMVGATVSGHFGYNVGDVYSRFYNLSYIGQNASGHVQVWPDGGIEDTQCWGGYADVSFGGKPMAIHLIGGIQHVQNDTWQGGDSNTRYALVARLPYSMSGSFTLSPEISYYSFGDDVNVPAGQSKDLGSEWMAGVQFQLVF